MGALTDPIIVFPSGWEETLPEKMKADLPLHRLAHNMACLHGKAQWEEACDLEALIYLYPAALAHPLSEQWTRIYLHLATRWLGDKAPQDIRQDTLSKYDQEELRHLKRWIYKKKVEARKARGKAGAEGEGQAVPARYEQMALKV